MSKTERTSGKSGGYFKGKSHEDCDENGCGIKAHVVASGETIEFEGGEGVINKKSMAEDDVLTVSGTPSEIASAINSYEGNGIEFDAGAKIKKGDHLEKGGKLNFKGLQNKVAKNYEGKKVPPKYQKEYGKRYSKEEAKEVGAKVAAKIAREKGLMRDGGQMTIEDKSTPSRTLFDTHQTFKDGGPIIGKNVTSNWDEVPLLWRNIKPIKKINTNFEPNNKEFKKLISPYLSKDELRPILSCALYNENHIVATDAHKLIVLPNKTGLEGIYPIAELKDKKGLNIKDGVVVDANYPNYNAVIPMYPEVSYKFTVYKLLQYAKAADNYTNKTTHQIAFIINEQIFGLNAKMLTEVLISALQYGLEELYIHFTEYNKAILFTENKSLVNLEGFNALQMPVVIRDEQTFAGAQDLDWKKKFTVKFDFEKDEIVNADGTIAEFKMNYGEPKVFDSKLIRVIKGIQEKSNTLPILDGFAVKNNNLFVSDLEHTLVIKNIDIDKGMYIIDNDAPTSYSDFNVEDFPIAPKFKDVRTKFSISAESLKKIVDIMVDYLGKDDLRPTMTTMNIKQYIGSVYCAATNAHHLCQLDITDFIQREDKNDFEANLPIRKLKYFATFATGKVTVEIGDKFTKYSSKEAELYVRNEDSKYPNYHAVVPRSTPNKLITDLTSVKKAFSSDKAQSFIRKHKKEASIIKFLGRIDKGDLSLVLLAEKWTQGKNEVIAEETIAVEKVKIQSGDFGTPDTTILIMPIMAEHNADFAFDVNLFQTTLNNLTGDTLEMFYTEPSKAYLFHGPEFDPKPIKIIDKTAPKPSPKKKTKALDVHKLSVNDQIRFDRGGRQFTADIEEVVSGGYIVDNFGFKKIMYDEITSFRKDGNGSWIEVKQKTKTPKQPKQDSEIQSIIKGLEILLKDAKGSEKTELEQVIAGLKLLDTDKKKAPTQLVNKIIDKINNLVESGKIYEYAGRCWFTAYEVLKKLKKSERAHVKLVEGTANGMTHYWLEVDGIIVDPHYKLIDNIISVEEDYSYKKKRELSFEDIELDKELFEEKPACNWNGKTKWSKVYQLKTKERGGFVVTQSIEDFDKKVNDDYNYREGGLTPSDKVNLYAQWRQLVNMSARELQQFLLTEEGKAAGLSKTEAKEAGVKSGHESTQWILKMKTTPKDAWTPKMWEWAKRQIAFIKRMKGVKGPLERKGKKTRKHTALLLWGHDPKKYNVGGALKSAGRFAGRATKVALQKTGEAAQKAHHKSKKKTTVKVLDELRDREGISTQESKTLNEAGNIVYDKYESGGYTFSPIETPI